MQVCPPALFVLKVPQSVGCTSHKYLSLWAVLHTSTSVCGLYFTQVPQSAGCTSHKYLSLRAVLHTSTSVCGLYFTQVLQSVGCTSHKYLSLWPELRTSPFLHVQLITTLITVIEAGVSKHFATSVLQTCNQMQYIPDIRE